MPAEYRIVKFEVRGFAFDASTAMGLRAALAERKASSFLSNNLMVFRGTRVTNPSVLQ